MAKVIETPSLNRASCWKFPAIVRRVIDADTIVVDLDQGFGGWQHDLQARLLGIDAPEKGTPDGDSATGHVKALLPPGSPCYVQTHSKDNFGRWLATVWAGEAAETLTEHLLAKGMGVPWKR